MMLCMPEERLTGEAHVIRPRPPSIRPILLTPSYGVVIMITQPESKEAITFLDETSCDA
jgi:hypothetical protein